MRVSLYEDNEFADQTGGWRETVLLPRRAPGKYNPYQPGKLLFFDPRLSGDNRMSCATCHIPEKPFADGVKTARGAAGNLSSAIRNFLLNAGLYTVNFRDGRASSLKQQALAPITAADEMNQDADELVRELSRVPTVDCGSTDSG